MPKQARLSRIKSFRCYTIEEAAEITGVSTRTIRNWSRIGLRLMDSARPILIRGDDLRSHIKAQRDGRRLKTRLEEFYCFRCRARRKAANGYADCVVDGKHVAISAFCERCEIVMNKPISRSRLAELSQILDLTITGLDDTL